MLWLAYFGLECLLPNTDEAPNVYILSSEVKDDSYSQNTSNFLRICLQPHPFIPRYSNEKVVEASPFSTVNFCELSSSIRIIIAVKYKFQCDYENLHLQLSDTLELLVLLAS